MKSVSILGASLALPVFFASSLALAEEPSQSTNDESTSHATQHARELDQSDAAASTRANETTTKKNTVTKKAESKKAETQQKAKDAAKDTKAAAKDTKAAAKDTKADAKDDTAAASGDASSNVPRTKPNGEPVKTHDVMGQKVRQLDDDTDIAVGQTQTTAADPNRPNDVIESRPEARREVEGRRISVAPLVGYGTNDYNLGVGARAGYTFETPIYVGGTFMYHVGGDGAGVGVTNAGVPVSTATSTSFMYPGVEVGYDFGLGPVLVRPYAGAGVMIGRTSTSVNGLTNSDTDSALMVYPGVTGQYFFPRTPVFVGGDMRGLIPFEKHGGSLSVFGTAGLSL